MTARGETWTAGARRYTILGVLGTGGFGKVYRARLEGGSDFSKEVAIKVLHDGTPNPDLLKRFRDEARILGLIRDRAIVSVDPPINLGGRWAVVMDYVDGSSLAALLREHGTLPAGVAVEIVGEIARVLDKAYHFPSPDGGPLEVLHRDIKPGNLQVTPTGEVRLLDFGVARATFSAREAKTTDAIAGTPGYMAPERLSGIEGPAGDVYSLGVVLWVMLTGERPADRFMVDLGGDLDEVAAGREELLPVLRLAARMRDLDPRKRPTAREVERDCRALRQGLPEPWLREWAEGARPGVLKTDALVGSVLTETLAGAVSDVQEIPTGAGTGRVRTVIAGGLAGLSALALAGSAALLALGLVGGLTWALWPGQARPVAPIRTTPVAVLDDGGPTVPTRTVAGQGEPEVVPVVPTPAPAPPGPRVRPDPAPAPVPEPVPEPTPEPVPAGPVRSIDVRSVPWGARVVVDGRVVGTTPLLGLELPDGDHELVLEMSDGRRTTRSIRVGSRSPSDYRWDVADDRWTAGMSPNR